MGFALVCRWVGVSVCVVGMLGGRSLQAQEPGSPTNAELSAQVRELQAAVAELKAEVAELRGVKAVAPAMTPVLVTPTVTNTPEVAAATVNAEDRTVLDAWHGTTLNTTLDGYYGYNFNVPVGHVNQLRAYAISSNSFGLNQATVVLEHAPDVGAGRRFGGRLDLQFGQATETLQGSAASEAQPQVWRNVFQAYGSYVAPIGSGLQVDFGKFASSLGVEGNYTKDQMNYSRALFFDYLPFYHMGFRANYNVSSKLNVAYWLVNGTQQTDDFNNFKSQAVLLTMKPAKTVTWTANYYVGREERDTTSDGAAIVPVPNGREHIFDTYATWTLTPKLTVVGEADLVVNRVYAESAPRHVAGGAAYARYQLPKGYALAARGEYLADPQGLYSGTSQALKEFTATLERQLGQGLVVRAEYRRDFSNQRYFDTSTAGVFSHAQPTATLGMVWWWGGKQGGW